MVFVKKKKWPVSTFGCLKKKENFEFVDQNHRLTPLEKNNVLYFEKFVVLF